MSISTLTILKEGKTKKILTSPYLSVKGLVIVKSKDDITAGDGAKHDVVQNKAKFANTTTCNVFELLKKCKIPLAFKEKRDETSFIAKACEMIPYEVVVRREAHGSYLKRNPFLNKGHLFPRLKVEFFLKTSGKQWKGILIPQDDPLTNRSAAGLALFLPKKPIYEQNPFLILKNYPLKDNFDLFLEMDNLARKVFLILEKSWEILGKKLVDFKLEFGCDTNGNLLLADVIDNDSWRLLDEGKNYIDKQVYRDGLAGLKKIEANYYIVAKETGLFEIPNEQLILWRASRKDDLTDFENEISRYNISCTNIITRSLHKEPIDAYQKLNEAIQECPNSVMIVVCGRSNGAGPTLSAQCSVPVITVPIGYKNFHEDIFSSLRTPSQVPVMTILEPKNAVLAAAEILSLKNPLVYASVRGLLEKRLCNIVEI